ILERDPSNPGNFRTIWSSTTGIGGYDLKSDHDKLLAYDISAGTENSLICYRPGNGIFWMVQNEGAGNFVGVYREGSNGIGGFDLKNGYDQIITQTGTPGNMELVCYRPGGSWVVIV